ncbi:MAG: MotA/TolQ/ExbB proton channel family protein [Tannerella sp.]|jgi:biopolymer transport protein ExbB|nr:MotA/TolQ/ExbB proton channel family protein [Tannerella sp.]
MNLLLLLQQIGNQANGVAAGAPPVLTDTIAATDAIDPLSTETQLNLIDLAMKGGWIMLVLLILSVFATIIFLKRFQVIRRANKKDEGFMNRIKDYIHDGKIDSAINLCRKTRNPSARMIEKGISRLGRPMNDVLVAIENVGNIEVAKLEKGFPILATIAASAPMLGFLGTVTGMVKAFFDMANAGANVDVTLLASGIYEALVTTVGGLVVGIVTLFGYNYLVAQVHGVINNMEARTMDFMDLLNEPAN